MQEHEESAAEHDFRRIYAHDINPNVEVGGPVIAVVCCHCGKSPLEVLESYVVPQVEADWPSDLRITAYYHDIEAGSSVEFTKRTKVADIDSLRVNRP